jgi:type IV pilus assembly protein PilA
MIVVVIIGLLAAMAIPAFQKVRATSQEKAIVNNLRQIGSAAQQYFLEEGVTSVNLTSLVGTDKWINQIETVASEVYPDSIDASSTSISVTNHTPVVTYTF